LTFSPQPTGLSNLANFTNILALQIDLVCQPFQLKLAYEIMYCKKNLKYHNTKEWNGDCTWLNQINKVEEEYQLIPIK
jgi:hypothetical protein